MGIFSKPPLSGLGRKKEDMPEGLWHKCTGCTESVHELELKKNLRVCPNCGHHLLMSAQERIESLADEGTFEEFDAGLFSKNPLHFAKYDEKIKRLRAATEMNDAVVTGRLQIDGQAVVVAVMDFQFFAGSMGSVVGEKIARAVETATAEGLPVLIFSASSGARMQEGMLSLMQMAKTSGALARHHEAGLAYISILTHPTTGGVTASFATLGDIILAEPKCMIGFAGPRVVKETTHQNLPPGFQTAEFMMEHGLVDRIVSREDMRGELSQIIGYLAKTPEPAVV
ncbi:MAG: acetyl-CoA carboxylase, carboxyltransferase subunit beta [Verrucomicrobiota bacterium]